MTQRKVFFAPLPLRAIGDKRLSRIDLHVLATIAFHDRMSNVSGKGQGAWMSHQSIADRIGCHYVNVSSSVTLLAKLGYLKRERHHLDARKHIYRVLFGEADSSSIDEPSPAENVSETANELSADERDQLSHSTNNSGEIVSPRSSKNRGNLPKPSSQYISLSDGIDFVETSEQHSAEAARRSSRDDDDESRSAGDGSQSKGAMVAAALARLEQALKHQVDEADLVSWSKWLSDFVLDPNADRNSANYQRAVRLADEVGLQVQQRIAAAAQQTAAVHRALVSCRSSAGDDGLAVIARGAGVLVDRVVAFVDGRDRLNAASIARLYRELCPNGMEVT